MDSALSTAQSTPMSLRRAAMAGETSRCARCVKDKKGCDRQFPCSRCIEYGASHLCVFTGSISTSRQRATPSRARQSIRSSLARNDSPLQLSNGEEEYGFDAGMVTPVSARQKKRTRTTPSHSEARSRGSARRRHVPAAERQVDEDWYREPPVRIEPPVDLEPEQTEEELARARILGGFTDIVTHLPIEIYRSSNFMRARDQSYISNSKALDEACRELQHTQDVARALTLRSEICHLMTECRVDRAEAIAEVAKLQTLIESHISLLSADIEKVENPASTTPPVISEDARPTETPVARKSKSSKQVEDSLDIPIDDDELTYCYCHRVSFGKMIACENEACEGGEWFHFDCLKIKTAPRGKWWCKTCTENGLAAKGFGTPKGIKGETMHEKRTRIREENRSREVNRRVKLRRQRRH